MPGKERQRRLARERYRRNVERRRESHQRTRKIGAVVGVIVVVALVAGGASVLALRLGGGEGASEAAAGTSRSAPSAAASAAPGACSYTAVPKSQRQGDTTFVGLPRKKPGRGGPYQATIKTNRGTIVMDLLAKPAPCTVNSFRFLAGKDFYDDTTCHRLVTTGIHILQCGDPSGTGRGGPGYTFPDENLKGATYQRGTVAMANSGPDTNGSQFFFVYQQGGLAPKYTPFARVVKGLDIVDKIAKAGPKDDGVAPRESLVIHNVRVSKRT